MTGILEARRHPDHARRPPDRLEELVLHSAAVHDRCPRAQAALVRAYERLVHKHAHGYGGPALEHEDLFAEGLAGFWRACEKFDPARGRLSTFAVWHVRAKMSRAVRRAGTVKIPSRVHDKVRRGELDLLLLEEGAE